MYINNLINKFGYSEMYEWSELFKYDIIPFGRFVTFDNNYPGKIRLANTGDYIIGVTTINSTIVSDDPDEWNGKYICNEFGDYYLQECEKPTAVQAYDEVNEMPYIATYKDSEILPVINDAYDSSKQYIKRSNRQEWIRVNLLGKCIVMDDGTCSPGSFCRVNENGIATTTDVMLDNSKVNKWYVIDRLTENTIMIFFK